MNAVKKTLVIFIAVLLARTLPAATYYVSKTGNDSNAGTSTNAAFLTISKAASLMVAGDTCYILSGTYRETVTPAHSGTSSSPITFAAYPGATPIVSGADLLDLSWSVYSNSIYMATPPAAISQLFVDGRMMNNARWPNAAVDQLLYAPRSAPTSSSVTNLNELTDSALSTNFNLLGAYLHFFASESGNQGYAANTRQITGWNPSTRTISWSGSVEQAQPTGCLYYLYGALCLLDIPTEWYYDPTNNLLYLWCPDGAPPANHVVETKNRTSAFTLDNLSYVTVNGIYVFGAGISMANTTYCVVDNCSLIYVQHNTTADWANLGVPIANEVSGTGSMWLNSVINYSSQDGIRLSGQNGVVSNCVIYNVDYYPGTYYASVETYGGATGSVIVGNTLWYSGRYCVGVEATPATVYSNDMGFAVLLSSDGGATYNYTGNGKGTQFHHNWAHDSWAGIYVDGGQENYIVYDNVCYNNLIGLLLNIETTNILVVNNTAFHNTASDIQSGATSQVDNQVINNLWQFPNATYGATDTVIDNGWYPPVGANGVLAAGSAGIHGGEYYNNSPIFQTGYGGGPPDIGAYQNGVTWVPGANFVPPPFPPLPTAPPFIINQPVSQSVSSAGQTIVFSASASGGPPLHYQWLGGAHNSGMFTNLVAGGAQYSAVTNAIFGITNVGSGNAGDYVVVVTNAYGSVTSSVAVLSVSGLNSAYQAAILADTPVSYWPMQETTGPTIYDAVGNNNGTLMTSTDGAALGADHHTNFATVGSGATDGATYLLGGPGGLPAVPGDTAIYFTNLNGSVNNSQIVIPYIGLLDPVSNFTAEAWIKVPAYPIGYTKAAFQTPLGLEANGGAVNGWWLGMQTDSSGSQGEAQFNVAYSPGFGLSSAPKSTSSLSGKWVYVVETYTGSNSQLQCYTNGVLMAGVTLSAPYESEALYGTHKLPFIIGSYCYDYRTGANILTGFERGNFWHGGISHVAIYNYALSAARISAHYQAGVTVVPPPTPTVSIQASDTNVIVSWTNGFLQQASFITGPWTYVNTNLSSPQMFGMTNQAQFFRAAPLP